MVFCRLNGYFPVNAGDINLKSKFTVFQRKKGNSQKPHKQYCYETVVGSAVCLYPDILFYLICDLYNIVCHFRILTTRGTSKVLCLLSVNTLKTGA